MSSLKSLSQQFKIKQRRNYLSKLHRVQVVHVFYFHAFFSKEIIILLDIHMVLHTLPFEVKMRFCQKSFGTILYITYTLMVPVRYLADKIMFLNHSIYCKA